jgi:hypothetical protein
VSRCLKFYLQEPVTVLNAACMHLLYMTATDLCVLLHTAQAKAEVRML